jgi:ABC-type uncharacterized transport system involved in gliding motility auxiliary subunit
MTTRRKQSVGGAALFVLAALFIALVVLSDALFRNLRLDLTEHRLYTISEGTKNILADLDEPIDLYYFFSQGATEGIPFLRSYGQRVRELLEELRDHAGAKLRLHLIDPLPFSEEEDQATSFGLEAVSLGGVGDPVYLGLAATNSTDGLEVLPFFQPDREAFLEYDLARLVWALANPRRPVIGLLTSLPMMRGFDPQTGGMREAWVVTTQLEQLFELRDLGPAPERIDDEIELLLVVHPKNLGEASLYAIDQFVMRGGKLVAFVDPQAETESQDPLQGQTGQAFEPRGSELNRLFEAWGFRMDSSTAVLDFGNALMVNVGGGGPVRHLAMLGIDADGLAGDEVVTAQLDQVNLATAGHVAPLEDAESSFTPLMQSSADSMLIPASRLRVLTDPAELMDEFEASGERLSIAARIEGELASAFADGPPTEAGGEHRARSDGKATLLVFADTDLLSDRLWVQVRSLFGQRMAQAFADNGALVTNALDHLAGSRDLISVRSRGSFSRPFERVDQLRREAEASLRAQEQRLQLELEETERKLGELEVGRRDDDSLLLSPEQEAELARFQDEKLRIRRALREVRRDLDASIDRLGTGLKVLNIAVMPMLVAIAGLGAASWRSRKRRRAVPAR